MGIVAYCPNGHRVKVKDEFAGRKGVCPECQARFRIPRGEAAGAGGAARQAEGYPVARVVSLDPAVAAGLPRAVAVAPTAPVSVQVGQPAAPRAAAAGAGGGVRVEQPAAPRAMSAEPPRGRQPVARTSLHPALAERPELTWSVAVPGGEASAPMSAEALQSLLDAGGLTGAELVWREGWADWVAIGLVFPECLPTGG